MNRALVVCAGPSFSVADWPRLREMGDTLVINFAHIPIRRAYGDSLLPTFAFTADRPQQTLPEEWHRSAEVLTVCPKGKAWRILQDAQTQYVEPFITTANPAWDADPWDKGHQLKGPYKSMLFALQWLYKQGYTTIGLYGSDLKHADTYGGIPEYHADRASHGKYRSHCVEAFCLYWWNQHAKRHGLRLVNLSPSSVLADFMETMTLDSFAQETEPPQSSEPTDYEALYAEAYSKGYHEDFQDSRAKRFVEELDLSLKFGSVLDVGCSKGWAVKAFQDRGKDSYGVEVCSLAVSEAQQRGLKVRQGTATSLPFESSSVDLVLSTDVMEHLHPADIERAIAEQVGVSKRYIAVKICPHPDSSGPKLLKRPLHLTVQPIQRWHEAYLRHGLRCIRREHHKLVYEVPPCG